MQGGTRRADFWEGRRMIAFPDAEILPPAVMRELRHIGDRLRTADPGKTVACAFGVGRDVRAWHDESGGCYFDLASLTKPLFTASSILGLLASAADLDMPVG